MVGMTYICALDVPFNLEYSFSQVLLLCVYICSTDPYYNAK